MATILYRDPNSGNFVPMVAAGPPVGVITPYAGSTAPQGWHICDGSPHGSAALQAVLGSANTPDLRDRFVVGAGATMPAKSTGGAATVLLTATQTGRPAHNHTAYTGTDSANHTHTFASGAGFSHTHASYWANFVDWADLSNTANNEPAAMSNSSKAQKAYATQGAHTHGGTSSGISANHYHSMAANTSSSNATAAHENRPPYYAMVYIIRTE